jgi:hypothetical protein
LIACPYLFIEIAKHGPIKHQTSLNHPIHAYLAANFVNFAPSSRTGVM